MMKINVFIYSLFVNIDHHLNYFYFIFMLMIYLNKLQMKIFNLIILKQLIITFRFIIVLPTTLHYKQTLQLFPFLFNQQIQNFHKKQVHLAEYFQPAMLLLENMPSLHLDHPMLPKSFSQVYYLFSKPRLFLYLFFNVLFFLFSTTNRFSSLLLFSPMLSFLPLLFIFSVK